MSEKICETKRLVTTSAISSLNAEEFRFAIAPRDGKPGALVDVELQDLQVGDWGLACIESFDSGNRATMPVRVFQILEQMAADEFSIEFTELYSGTSLEADRKSLLGLLGAEPLSTNQPENGDEQ